jgi:TetR/AcrR family transcriptional repressor of mexJK operon
MERERDPRLDQATTAVTGTGRERIIDAAFRKFADLGYSGVSMQQIASAAGVTKATLYHHFEDKEDLFVQMMRDRFTRSQARLAHSVDAGETFREKLVAYGNVLFSEERADLSRLFGDFHRYVAEARQATFWDDHERPWTYLETAIERAMADGELRAGDPALMSQICFSAFVGQLQIARFGSDIPYPPLALVGEIADMLLAGLEPRADQ